MKACRGRRVTGPLILTSTLDGSEWLTSHPGLDTLAPGKNPGNCLNRRLGGPSSLDVLEKRKSLSVAGIQTMDCPACSLVAEGIVSPWSITNISLNCCSSHIAKYTFKHAIQFSFTPIHPAHYST